jgi:hypothetical protein
MRDPYSCARARKTSGTHTHAHTHTRTRTHTHTQRPAMHAVPIEPTHTHTDPRTRTRQLHSFAPAHSRAKRRKATQLQSVDSFPAGGRQKGRRRHRRRRREQEGGKADGAVEAAALGDPLGQHGQGRGEYPQYPQYPEYPDYPEYPQYPEYIPYSNPRAIRFGSADKAVVDPAQRGVRHAAPIGTPGACMSHARRMPADAASVSAQYSRGYPGVLYGTAAPACPPLRRGWT